MKQYPIRLSKKASAPSVLKNRLRRCVSAVIRGIPPATGAVPDSCTLSGRDAQGIG